MSMYFALNTCALFFIPFVASYDFFFLYTDRDHDGKIDVSDIEKIRNPAWLKEWNSFDISKFLPIEEQDFQLFIEGINIPSFYHRVDFHFWINLIMHIIYSS